MNTSSQNSGRPGQSHVGSKTQDPRLDELLAKVADRQVDSFEELYDLTVPLVYGIVLRVLKDPTQSEEVTQEVFLEVWNQAQKFSSKRGSTKSWIATIAHRRAVDRVRSEQSARNRDDAFYKDSDFDIDLVAKEMNARFEAEIVAKAFKGLTEPQRQALSLAYFEGYTYAEVAELLDTPPGTIKTRIRDGLARLRDLLEGS